MANKPHYDINDMWIAHHELRKLLLTMLVTKRILSPTELRALGDATADAASRVSFGGKRHHAADLVHQMFSGFAWDQWGETGLGGRDRSKPH